MDLQTTDHPVSWNWLLKFKNGEMPHRSGSPASLGDLARLAKLGLPSHLHEFPSWSPCFLEGPDSPPSAQRLGR